MFWNDIPTDDYKVTIKLRSKAITKSSFLYRLSYYHQNKRKELSMFFLKRRQNVKVLKELDWADVDSNGRIIATLDGILMASKIFKDGSVQISNLEQLHDLNSQKPTKIAVPNEMRKW